MRFYNKFLFILFKILFSFFILLINDKLKAQYSFNPIQNKNLLTNSLQDNQTNFYTDFSSNLTFFSHQVLRLQNALNLQISFPKYKSLLKIFILQEKQFLVKQNFGSLGYIYYLTLNKKSKLIFLPSIHYNTQNINTQDLLFPSQLVTKTNVVPFDFSSFKNWGIDFGLQYSSQSLNFNFKVNNVAFISKKGDFGNTRQILFSFLNYNFLLNKFARKKLQVGIGIWQESINYKFISLKYSQQKNYLKMQVMSNKYIPNSFTVEIGISHKNYIFAYQFWLETIANSPARLINNGIKIVYNFKENKKSKDRNAISCPKL